MRRRVGSLSVGLAVVAALAAGLVARLDPLPGSVVDTSLSLLAARGLWALAVVLEGYGLYVLVSFDRDAPERRRGEPRVQVPSRDHPSA